MEAKSQGRFYFTLKSAISMFFAGRNEKIMESDRFLKRFKHHKTHAIKQCIGSIHLKWEK